MAKKTSNKKKKKTASKKANTASVQAQMRQELTEGIAEIAEVTITIPLSSVTKNLHTRMFIQTQLSLPQLQNMKQLGEIFKANAYYYGDTFVKNVWFIKKTKVTVSPTEESMTLTLVPFNDSFQSEADTLAGLSEQKTNTTSTSSTSTSSSTANSTTNLKLNKVAKGADQTFLEEIVKKAIGTKTDKLAQAKACYKYYQDHHVYHLNSTSVESDYQRGFKSLWNQEKHSCGPGAATLFYMFKCIGLHPMIMNGHNHYWIDVEIDGQTYHCDQAGAEGTHNMCTNGKSRVMSTGTGHCVVYGGANGGSIRMRG